MKYWIILLILTFSLMAADATKASQSLGIYNDYAMALQNAKSKNELMVFVVVWDPCKTCDSLVKETLVDKNVQSKLKESTTLILDYKAKMPEKFIVKMAPFIYYINPQNEEILYESMGRISAKTFQEDYEEAKSFLGEE